MHGKNQTLLYTAKTLRSADFKAQTNETEGDEYPTVHMMHQ